MILQLLLDSCQVRPFAIAVAIAVVIVFFDYDSDSNADRSARRAVQLTAPSEQTSSLWHELVVFLERVFS